MKTALEAVLQAMVTGGWANESDGSVDSPTGAFARVTNDEPDLPSIIDAFNDVMDTYDMTDNVNELVGHLLVQESDQGLVTITSFTDPVELTKAFQELQDAYAQWDEE